MVAIARNTTLDMMPGVTAHAERILVVGPAWVGDMVMAQSLFMHLRQRDVDCVIDVLAPSWSQPLLARMNEVREAIVLPLGHGQFGLAHRYRLGRSLRERYDRAIVIPRSFKAALVAFFARIPRRTGYRGEWRYGLLNDIHPLDKSLLRQTVQRYVALGGPADGLQAPPHTPFPRLHVDMANRERVLSQLGLDRQREVVAMMPGAEYGSAKRWPPAHYAQLAQSLLAAGKQIWVFGSDKDKAVAEMIIAGVGVSPADSHAMVNLCGRTRLEDVVDLLSLAQVAVSNDSGLMHVAAAVGVPLVAIYGSSTPEYTPPLSERAEVVYRALECSPCFKRTCPLGHTDCLNGIASETVLAQVNKQLKVGGKADGA